MLLLITISDSILAVSASDHAPYQGLVYSMPMARHLVSSSTNNVLWHECLAVQQYMQVMNERRHSCGPLFLTCLLLHFQVEGFGVQIEHCCAAGLRDEPPALEGLKLNLGVQVVHP